MCDMFNMCFQLRKLSKIFVVIPKEDLAADYQAFVQLVTLTKARVSRLPLWYTRTLWLPPGVIPKEVSVSQSVRQCILLAYVSVTQTV